MDAQFKTLRDKIAAEKQARLQRYAGFEAMFREAYRLGYEVGQKAFVKPIAIIEAYSDGTPKPDAPVYIDDHGACGFAYVVIRPATSSFARWLVANKLARRHWAGGVEIWISDHGQSYERKVAHACAMAAHFTANGIGNARAGARLD